jgi:hypothetical protein
MPSRRLRMDGGYFTRQASRAQTAVRSLPRRAQGAPTKLGPLRNGCILELERLARSSPEIPAVRFTSRAAGPGVVAPPGRLSPKIEAVSSRR